MTKTQKWRAKNPEYGKNWRLKNLDRVRAQARAWKARNQEKANVYLRFWRQRTGKGVLGCAARRALKKKVTVGDLTAIAKVYDKAKQYRDYGFDVAVDHVIPLTKNGTHEASNLQIIYASENIVKNNKLDYTPRVIFI